MAKRSAKRDGAYYERLLSRRYPTVYSDFKAGKYPSLRQALIAAGIRQELEPSKELMRYWKRATPTERADFLGKIGSVGGGGSRPGSSATTLVDSTGYLLPEVADTIKCIIAVRDLKMGAFANELGFPVNDFRVSASVHRNQRVPSEVVAALETWIATNKHLLPRW